MTVIHANDPTTKMLSALYEQHPQLAVRITEESSNVEVRRAIQRDDTIMMLGHGNEYGLFSTPNKNGKYERLLITDRHVEFLRNKTCIGIWCYAHDFAKHYGLYGLFSGMIISELSEAEELNVSTTQEEVEVEIVKFASRLRYCLDHYELHEIPSQMLAMDDMKSELTTFNYSNLYFCNQHILE